MDYLKINNVSIPYPNDFTLTKSKIIASEIQTMTGAIHADIVGWKYADTTLGWDALLDSDLSNLLNQLADPFVLTCETVEGDEVELNAYCASSVSTKSRYRDTQGRILWTDIKLEVVFTDAYSY